MVRDIINKATLIMRRYKDRTEPVGDVPVTFPATNRDEADGIAAAIVCANYVANSTDIPNPPEFSDELLAREHKFRYDTATHQATVYLKPSQPGERMNTAATKAISSLEDFIDSGLMTAPINALPDMFAAGLRTSAMNISERRDVIERVLQRISASGNVGANQNVLMWIFSAVDETEARAVAATMAYAMNDPSKNSSGTSIDDLLRSAKYVFPCPPPANLPPDLAAKPSDQFGLAVIENAAKEKWADIFSRMKKRLQALKERAAALQHNPVAPPVKHGSDPLQKQLIDLIGEHHHADLINILHHINAGDVTAPAFPRASLAGTLINRANTPPAISTVKDEKELLSHAAIIDDAISRIASLINTRDHTKEIRLVIKGEEVATRALASAIVYANNHVRYLDKDRRNKEFLIDRLLKQHEFTYDKTKHLMSILIRRNHFNNETRSWPALVEEMTTALKNVKLCMKFDEVSGEAGMYQYAMEHNDGVIAIDNRITKHPQHLCNMLTGMLGLIGQHHGFEDIAFHVADTEKQFGDLEYTRQSNRKELNRKAAIAEAAREKAARRAANTAAATASDTASVPSKKAEDPAEEKRRAEAKKEQERREKQAADERQRVAKAQQRMPADITAIGKVLHALEMIPDQPPESWKSAGAAKGADTDGKDPDAHKYIFKLTAPERGKMITHAFRTFADALDVRSSETLKLASGETAPSPALVDTCKMHQKLAAEILSDKNLTVVAREAGLGAVIKSGNGNTASYVEKVGKRFNDGKTVELLSGDPKARKFIEDQCAVIPGLPFLIQAATLQPLACKKESGALWGKFKNKGADIDPNVGLVTCQKLMNDIVNPVIRSAG